MSPSKLRDRLKLHAPAGVQADRERILRGIGAENRRAGRDDSLSQQRRRLCPAGLLVEHLEADDERCERVAAQRPDRRRHDACGSLLARLRVGPAGAAFGEAVDRPPPADVLLIVAAEQRSLGVDRRRVRQALRLRAQQSSRAVAQPAQSAELGRIVRAVANGTCSPSCTTANSPLGSGTRCPSHSPSRCLCQLRLRLGEQDAAINPARLPLQQVSRPRPDRSRAGDGLSHPRAPGADPRGDRRGARIAVDDELVVLIQAAGELQLAEHLLRVLGQVAVQPQLVAVDVDELGPDPAVVGWLCALGAAPQDQEVRDGLRARYAPVRAAGQPHSADQVSQGADLAPGGRVRCVERIPAAQQHREAARPRQRQALDDEVVVDRVARSVVLRVIQLTFAERHVADRQVEAPARQPAGCGPRTID